MVEPVVIGDARLFHGDCIDVMKTFPDNSIAAIVTDPPYLLSFMGKAFDKQHKAMSGENEGQKMQAWHKQWIEEAYRILKPGGFIAAFGGDRTHHRLLCAMEDAGFELRQNLYWCFGAGFPKNQDASRALDRHFGKLSEREVVGIKQGHGRTSVLSRTKQVEYGYRPDGAPYGEYDGTGLASITAPATDAARQWSGWGSALKPAVEIICCARKPMIGTLAENLLEWGTGAINIDGCRVPGIPETTRFNPEKHSHEGWRMNATGKECAERASQQLGRYPAHLLHDGSEEVLALFPVTTSGKILPHHQCRESENRAMSGKNYARFLTESPGDSGSAARFFQACPYDAGDFDPLFYSGKANKRDRDEGCDGFDFKQTTFANGTRLKNNGDGSPRNKEPSNINHHVSVKPLSLMRWLTRLLVPPGETVLDPFMGSGSTLKAALLEGFNCIGIEREPDYFEIACARVAHVSPEAFDLKPTSVQPVAQGELL